MILAWVVFVLALVAAFLAHMAQRRVHSIGLGAFAGWISWVRTGFLLLAGLCLLLGVSGVWMPWSAAIVVMIIAIAIAEALRRYAPAGYARWAIGAGAIIALIIIVAGLASRRTGDNTNPPDAGGSPNPGTTRTNQLDSIAATQGAEKEGTYTFKLTPGSPAVIKVPLWHRWDPHGVVPVGWAFNRDGTDSQGRLVRTFEVLPGYNEVELTVLISRCKTAECPEVPPTQTAEQAKPQNASPTSPTQPAEPEDDGEPQPLDDGIPEKPEETPSTEPESSPKRPAIRMPYHEFRRVRT